MRGWRLLLLRWMGKRLVRVLRVLMAGGGGVVGVVAGVGAALLVRGRVQVMVPVRVRLRATVRLRS